MASTEVLPLDPLVYRADFPILSTVLHGDKPLVYFDNAATTQRPQPGDQRRWWKPTNGTTPTCIAGFTG